MLAISRNSSSETCDDERRITRGCGCTAERWLWTVDNTAFRPAAVSGVRWEPVRAVMRVMPTSYRESRGSSGNAPSGVSGDGELMVVESSCT